jgi:exonuclease-1
VYLILDGLRVPLKSGPNANREARRRRCLKEARMLKRRGMGREAGKKCLQCVRGTKTMARVVARAVERRWGTVVTDNDNNRGRKTMKDDRGDNNGVRVRCVWSPYKAEAQLAKLCVDGLADLVVTEDLDVLVYLVVTRVPFPVIYKLNRGDGLCDVITMDWLLNPTFDPIGGNGGRGRDGQH